MADLQFLLSTLIEEPSPQTWNDAAEYLDGIEQGQREKICKEIRLVLKHWPEEIPRDPLEHWDLARHDDLLRLCVKVNETSTYGYYIEKIEGASCLRLSNKRYGCRVQRFFSGAALSHSGNRWIRIGQKGQADLVGSLSIEFKNRIFPVYLELEVKMPKGRMNPAQKMRRDMLERRGELYLCARSVKDSIQQLLAAKLRLESDPSSGLILE